MSEQINAPFMGSTLGHSPDRIRRVSDHVAPRQEAPWLHHSSAGAAANPWAPSHSPAGPLVPRGRKEQLQLPETTWHCRMHPECRPPTPLPHCCLFSRESVCLFLTSLGRTVSCSRRRETIHDFQITCPKKQTHTFWHQCSPPRGPGSGNVLQQPEMTKT